MSIIKDLSKGNKEYAFKFYQETLINARFLIDKIWSCIRFFITILSALLTFSLATFLTNTETLNLNKIYLIPILVIIIFLAIVAIANSFREYKHYLEYIVIMDKLQEKLGVYDEFKSKLYPKDKYLLPKRFIKKDIKTSREFIKKNIFLRGNLLFYIVIVYSLFIFLSLLIITLIIL